MKSKRMLFVLFTCVFALYGCVSTGAFGSDTANYEVNVSKDTTDRVQMFTKLNSGDMRSTALIAYGQPSVDTQLFTNVRNSSGILITKGDVEALSKQLMNQAKEEKAQRDEEIRRKKEQELWLSSCEWSWRYGDGRCSGFKSRGHAARWNLAFWNSLW